jgi:hypothetical protein
MTHREDAEDFAQAQALAGGGADRILPEGGAMRRARGGLRRLSRAARVAGLIALCGLVAPAVASAATGGISGKVTNSATSAAIEGAKVCAYEGPTEECKTTNASGEYTIENLQPSSEYEVYVSAAGFGGTDLGPVDVESGKVTKNVNIALKETGGISGRLTVAGGAPLALAYVCVEYYYCSETNANGEYTIEDLDEGTYDVEFEPPCKSELDACNSSYITQYWNDKLTEETAERVSVTAGKTTKEINAELQIGGQITGKVTNGANGLAISGVYVCADPTLDERGPCAYTNSAGEYTLPGLASGSYEVYFSGEVCVEASGEIKCTHPWVTQYYQALVSVTAPAVSSGINGSLLERGHEKPVSTAAPAVAGTATPGVVLSCSQGSWGNTPTTFAYQWLRNGVAIAGQTSATYTVQSIDEGTGLSCQVTAANAAGSSAATSTAALVPKPAPGVAVVTSASAKGATATLTLKCTGASACKGVLKLVASVTEKVGKHKHTRNVVIGTASFSIAADGHETLQVHLSSQGSKLLRQAGKKGLKVQFTGTSVTAHTLLVK